MPAPQSLAALRKADWSTIPSSPGVYWWYFAETARKRFGIPETGLELRESDDGKVCLFLGMAKNLSQRIKWHAQQKLTIRSLESGFLSTFRLTLLALNDIDYLTGNDAIDNVFDELYVTWKPTKTREEAKIFEMGELLGKYHFPLNISGNHRSELEDCAKRLKSVRREYKRRFVPKLSD